MMNKESEKSLLFMPRLLKMILTAICLWLNRDGGVVWAVLTPITGRGWH
jgi:hypothetical protein